MKPGPVVPLLGPSGSGKSTLRSWLAEDLGFLDVELDGFEASDQNPVDLLGLRAQWDRLYDAGDAGPLALEMRARAEAATKPGAVLSFPSLVVLPAATIAAAEKVGLFVVIVMDRREQYRAAFLERQGARGAAALGGDHWDRNARTFEAFEASAFSSYRLWTFGPRGRVQRQVLVEAVRKRIGLA